MRRAWGNITDRIALSLSEDGPACTLQLARRLGLSQSQVAGCIVRLCRVQERGPNAGQRRAHITGWMRESIAGGRSYLRAIYAAGHRFDSRSPGALTQSQRNKRRVKRSAKRAAATAEGN